jgi:hypothetical protein
MPHIRGHIGTIGNIPRFRGDKPPTTAGPKRTIEGPTRPISSVSRGSNTAQVGTTTRKGGRLSDIKFPVTKPPRKKANRQAAINLTPGRDPSSVREKRPPKKPRRQRLSPHKVAAIQEGGADVQASIAEGLEGVRGRTRARQTKAQAALDIADAADAAEAMRGAANDRARQAVTEEAQSLRKHYQLDRDIVGKGRGKAKPDLFRTQNLKRAQAKAEEVHEESRGRLAQALTGNAPVDLEQRASARATAQTIAGGGSPQPRGTAEAKKAAESGFFHQLGTNPDLQKNVLGFAELIGRGGNARAQGFAQMAQQRSKAIETKRLQDREFEMKEEAAKSNEFFRRKTVEAQEANRRLTEQSIAQAAERVTTGPGGTSLTNVNTGQSRLISGPKPKPNFQSQPDGSTLIFDANNPTAAPLHVPNVSGPKRITVADRNAALTGAFKVYTPAVLAEFTKENTDAVLKDLTPERRKQAVRIRESLLFAAALDLNAPGAAVRASQNFINVHAAVSFLSEDSQKMVKKILSDTFIQMFGGNADLAARQIAATLEGVSPEDFLGRDNRIKLDTDPDGNLFEVENP